MKNIRLPKNPYLLFCPFLAVYILYILLVQKNVLWGDEIRHFDQAQNILHGYFSTSGTSVEIRNGPGYPLLLMPFVALKLPLLAIKLLNALFLYLSVVFLFKSLRLVVSFRLALIFSLFWGCYYNSLNFIALLYSEVFAVFLVSLLLFFLLKSFKQDSNEPRKKYVCLSGFILGFLTLTKVIFGYVIVCLLIGCGLLWLLNRKQVNYQRAVVVLLLSLATVAPYLIYTYQLTGKVFYWGTSGGDNLYWMTTPYENEYGSWFSGSLMGADSVTDRSGRGHKIIQAGVSDYIPGTVDSLRMHHLKDYVEVYKYQGVERDEAFTKIVVKNIKAHPVKYLKNCFSNLGRMLFSFPYSYTAQKPATLARLPLNGAIVFLALFCIIPTFLNWRKIIFPVRFMLFATLLYLGGSILTSADIRMFTVIVPLLLIWIAFVIQRSVKIKTKFDEKGN